ncbi:MAG TPA: MarC family protein, partial [Thermoplasmata archaeon]|nr:MarC family protein [Thermoplasmata archaeon]
VTVSLFALVDPIGTLPFYAALTEGFESADRAVVLRRSVSVVGVVLFVFAIGGRFVFQAFGFTLGAFEIAGGILLFIVAYDMLRGETARTRLTPADREEALARRDEVSVVPLGIPLLAGPGAISTVMIYAGYSDGDPIAIASVFVAIAVTTAATFLVLHYGHGILQYLGRVGIMALTRVMGLLLAAIAVQFVLTGLAATIPQL